LTLVRKARPEDFADAARLPFALTAARVRRLCDVGRGFVLAVPLILGGVALTGCAGPDLEALCEAKEQCNGGNDKDKDNAGDKGKGKGNAGENGKGNGASHDDRPSGAAGQLDQLAKTGVPTLGWLTAALGLAGLGGGLLAGARRGRSGL
jgi:hypothetical protein